MTVTTYKWSINEWHKLVNTGVLADKSVELIEGEITVMSPEGVEHSYSNQSVADFLRELLRGKAYIRDAHPVTLKNSEPEPDIAIVKLPKTIYAEHHPYPQDVYWLIEVSKNTLKFDLELKSKVYARNGISEYWVIDLIGKKLIVHTQPQKDAYSRIEELVNGTIAPQTFPQIVIPLDKLLLS